jgi:hypothetical protein
VQDPNQARVVFEKGGTEAAWLFDGPERAIDAAMILQCRGLVAGVEVLPGLRPVSQEFQRIHEMRIAAMKPDGQAAEAEVEVA